IPLPIGIGTSAQSFHNRYCAVGRKEIEPSVVVVVEPSNPEPCERETGSRQAQLQGHVAERTSMVTIESASFGGKIRDQQIFISVIVEIPRSHAHSGSCHAIHAVGCASQQSRFFKCPIALVDP